MTYADIKLGYTCNNNCIHCVIADQRKLAFKLYGRQDRTTEEYKSELMASRRNGCNFVTFTGGEPTLRKDLFELLAYAKMIGYSIGMQTNGRMFYYSDFAKKLQPLGIHYTVALHGPSEELHDRITRAPGSFRQTREGIKNLVALGQEVTGKIVISKLNCNLLKDICVLFMQLGVRSMDFAFPHANGNAWENASWVVPTYTEIKPFVDELIAFVEDHNESNPNQIKIDFEAIPFCFLKGKEKYVGELEFIGKTYSELKQLDGKVSNWQDVRKKIKTKFLSCKKCPHDRICEGVWNEYPLIHGSSEFGDENAPPQHK